MRDLRYAVRSLRKSPVFAFVATLCLGLALALNMTTVAILDAILYPSLPVSGADLLFSVTMWGAQAGRAQPWDLYAVLKEGRFYQDITFYDRDLFGLVQVGEEVWEQPVYRFDEGFFELLGVEAELGRLPRRGAPEDVAVVSHDFWARSLGARTLDGPTIWVKGHAYRVVAVLPSQMPFPGADVWIPVSLGSKGTGYGLLDLNAVVRVRRGWTPELVRAELTALARRVTLEYGLGPVPYAFATRSLVSRTPELRQIHIALAGAAFMVLLISCANLANLMLVRGVARRREIAVCMALGADRRTVARQVLAEGSLLGAAGTVMGLVLTAWAIQVVRNQMPTTVATLGIVAPHANWRVFTAGVLVACGTVVAFGLWPALSASDVDVGEQLKEVSGAGTTRARWRYNPLVIAEMAFTLALVMGAALLAKGTGRLARSTLGFEREGLLDAMVWRGASSVSNGDSASRVLGDLLARIAALPGVRSAAARRDGGATSRITSEFYDGTRGFLPRASLNYVTEGFLRTLGVPLLQGRDFLPSDAHSGAVIVDETVAAALWPDRSAVGRLIEVNSQTGERTWRPVVGIARRALVGGPAEDPYLDPQGGIYVAWEPRDGDGMWRLAIRTRGLDGRVALALRETIQDAMVGGRAMWIWPWMRSFDRTIRARYFLISVFGAFSTFALLLAAVGLYGVVSYSVSQRLREFAVRIAMGAGVRHVARLVAHQAAVISLAAIGAGAFVAMWASRLLGDWLYDLYHTDVASLVFAEAILAVTVCAVCIQPILRAMRVSPTEMLRAS